MKAKSLRSQEPLIKSPSFSLKLLIFCFINTSRRDSFIHSAIHLFSHSFKEEFIFICWISGAWSCVFTRKQWHNFIKKIMPRDFGNVCGYDVYTFSYSLFATLFKHLLCFFSSMKFVSEVRLRRWLKHWEHNMDMHFKLVHHDTLLLLGRWDLRQVVISGWAVVIREWHHTWLCRLFIIKRNSVCGKK